MEEPENHGYVVFGKKPETILDLDNQLYQKMTSEDEQKILTDLIINDGPEKLLGIGNIYSEAREHYNNDILERFAEFQRQEWIEGIDALLQDHCCRLEEPFEAPDGKTYPLAVSVHDWPEDMSEAERECEAGFEGTVVFYTIDDLVNWITERGWWPKGQPQLQATP